MAGWCCCPECVLLEADFDCCPLRDGVCYDESNVMVDTQDLGDDWDWGNATGEWWKGLSTQPQYQLNWDDSCDDGALYEVSGGGILTCKIPAEQDGFQFACDILDFDVGTHLRLHFWHAYDNPSGGFIVDWQVTEIRETEPGVFVWVISVSGGGCSFETYATYTPGSHTRAEICVGYSDKEKRAGIAVYRCIGDPVPSWNLVCSDLDYGDGYFSLENAGGQYLILDDLYWGRSRWFTWSETSEKVREIPCFGMMSCYCVDGENPDGVVLVLPRTMYLYLHWYNCQGYFPPATPDDLAITLRVPDPANPCACGYTIWESDPIPTPWYGETQSCPDTDVSDKFWKFQVTCGPGNTFYILVTWGPDEDGPWTEALFPSDSQLANDRCSPFLSKATLLASRYNACDEAVTCDVDVVLSENELANPFE